jgi:hypothetical protein
MTPSQNPRLPGFGSSNWLQRTIVGIAALSLAILATLFLTIALIAGAFIALGIGARWWWTLRKLRHQAKASAPLEGEYTVVERAEPSARLEGKQRVY